MSFFSQKVYPKIGEISIWLGAVSLFAHILATFLPKFTFLKHFFIVYIYDYINIILSVRGIGEYKQYPFSPISALFYAMLILGGILYLKTKTRDSRLLKFGYSMIFIHNLASLIGFPLYYYRNQQYKASNELGIKIPTVTNLDYLLLLILSIGLVILSYKVAKWLIFKNEVQLQETINKNGEQTFTPIKSSLSKRFTHFIFDKIIVVYMIFPIVSSYTIFFLGGSKMGSLNQVLASKWLFTLTFGLSLFVYYLLMEGIFGSTPIKCLTGTRVVDEKHSKKPRFGNILGRSLVRFFPFDGVSFFWEKGWHDSFSETIVVEENHHEPTKKYHIWWVFAILGIYILPLIYGTVIEKIDRDQHNKFTDQEMSAMKRSTVYHLEAGDVILAKKDVKDYRSPHYLLNVLSVESKTIVAQRFYISDSKRGDYSMKSQILNKPLDELELLDTISLDKDSLFWSYQRPFHNGIIVNDSLSLYVSHIYQRNHPIFESSGSSSRYTDSITEVSIRFRNEMIPLNIIKIEKIEGNVELVLDLPMSNEFNHETNYGSFSLNLISPKRKYHFKALATLLYNDQSYEYVLNGFGGSVYFYRAIPK